MLNKYCNKGHRATHNVSNELQPGEINHTSFTDPGCNTSLILKGAF